MVIDPRNRLVSHRLWTSAGSTFLSGKSRKQWHGVLMGPPSPNIEYFPRTGSAVVDAFGLDHRAPDSALCWPYRSRPPLTFIIRAALVPYVSSMSIDYHDSACAQCRW